ncbi:MAG TPA: ribosome silencing factor [Solirubrobacterales bacterium]|nr:ribosome silencing factor [Solirubrobacterales bacterium]
MTAAELARRIAGIADAKQASEIVGLDVSALVGYTDVIVICTARNERLAKAICDDVHQQLKHEEDLLPSHTEGVGENRWILLDYLDCVLHVFVPETRERYRLDQLWGEAERIELGLEEASDAVRGSA